MSPGSTRSIPRSGLATPNLANALVQAAIGMRLDGPTWKANTPDAFSYEASTRVPGEAVGARRRHYHYAGLSCLRVQELKPETNETELASVRSQYQNVTALLAEKRK